MDPASPVTPPHVAGPLELAPFRSLRLASNRIGDPMSARLFARPFAQVPDRVRQWEQRGHLVHDAQPALYLHEYTSMGLTVRGLVGALDVARRAAHVSERAILPHEGIYPAQADDLADRMGAMRINPAPILLVQHSPSALREVLARARAGAPSYQFVDRAGHSHRVWALRDPSVLAQVAESLAPTTALIADGHHRYAAYLRLQQRDPGSAADRGLAMIVDQDDTPLFLGAIHRVLSGTTSADLAAAARSLGLRVEDTAPASALAGLSPRSLVATDGTTAVTVHCDRPENPDTRAVVEILHDDLVPALARGPKRITYHHAVTDALERGTSPRTTAVLMPSIELDEVLHIAEDDRVLPEKATSFQPKPGVGVFLRSLNDE